ncbi:MAG: hypothetical protein H7A55_11600 [Verrucomicrobiaceae bacterium]|nr:hypothetical protein [Verrucomicrobiaceae bacterium]
MRPHLFPIFLLTTVLSISCLLSLSGADGDAELRVRLEKVYYDWRGAIINQDTAAWQRATSRYRQVMTKNLILSQQQVYPDAVFEVPIRPPELTQLRRLEVQAVGPTAHMIYFGKVDLGLDAESVPDNLLILRFLKEGDDWKFDTTRYMNLAGVPEIRASLAGGGDPDFLDKPEFNPPGYVPPVPKECGKPDYMAAYHIQSYGYAAIPHLNGFDYPKVEDNAENQLIIGGLMKGKNDFKLDLKPTPVPEGEERYFEINVMVITPNGEKPAVPVLQWSTKDANPPASQDLPLWVNSSTLKK